MIWLIDAGFKWTPGFRDGYLGDLRGAAVGQPGWLHWWFSFWINLQKGDPHVFVYLTAVIETLVGIALVLGFARKFTYISGALFAFIVWAVAEGFGGPYISGSTDIGAAVIYVVVFLSLLAISAQEGTSRYSLDALIERRLSWWHWIAEVGGHRRYRTPASAVTTTTDQPAAAIHTTADERVRSQT
ncbi:MAG TPA: DoxX family protein [Gaiellaceae bacterium]|nr:DoxX family protein [Gaiellaceae bacterium]